VRAAGHTGISLGAGPSSSWPRRCPGSGLVRPHGITGANATRRCRFCERCGAVLGVSRGDLDAPKCGLLMPPQVRRAAGSATWPGRAGTRRAGVGQLPAAGRRGRAYIDSVKPPFRLSIPGCIGCGAMRQYESCVAVCRERRLELVSGGDYDELTAAAAACRVRIEGLWAVVAELARTEPGPGGCRVAYEALRQSSTRQTWRCPRRRSPVGPGAPYGPAPMRIQTAPCTS